MALVLAVVEAGIYHLPITRTTSGLYFTEPDIPRAERHNGQIALASPPLEDFQKAIRNHDTFFASIAQKHCLRNSAQQELDDGDDDGEWDAMFFSLYTTTISVGNPPLRLSATVDTSWSTLFIPSVNCTYMPGNHRSCTAHPLYNSSLSSTYRPDLTPASVLYTGPAGIYTWGNVSQDNLHVAGMEIKGQMFEEATVWNPDVGTRNDLFDTALGISLFPTRSGNGRDDFAAPSPFQNMMQQKLLDKNIISLKLGRTDQEMGEIILGGLPRNVQREDMIEVPLDHNKTDDSDHIWRYYTMNGWQVSVKSMSMGMNSSEASTSVLDKPQTAVISSSFPWIGVPDEVAKKIHETLGIKQVFDWVNCEKRPRLPNWTITFGPNGHTITLSPWDYLIEVYDKVYGQLKCVSGFFNLSQYGDKGFIILGAPFLNGIYSTFDADRKSISFGNRPL
ncbi:aspartic peptidase domain-containing protein [Pyrenochaeta sp. MPI-SDFR-AT-0127]|nr:aspartic peptidase domain-containing protein [Pyrenochaeta sp. MPI-SDFR-AT-0127]